MRTVWWIVAVFGPVVALAGFPAGSPAWAAPDNGFGLGIGLAGHHVALDWTRTPSFSYDSVGLSLAGDAQFAAAERWSLNPFLLLSLEKAHGNRDAVVSNGAAGFQVRRWSGAFYLAAHAGMYVELLVEDGTTGTYYGPGFGAGLGSEPRDGLGWGAQVDFPRTFVSDEFRVGLRLHLTHRWR